MGSNHSGVGKPTTRYVLRPLPACACGGQQTSRHSNSETYYTHKEHCTPACGMKPPVTKYPARKRIYAERGKPRAGRESKGDRQAAAAASQNGAEETGERWSQRRCHEAAGDESGVSLSVVALLAGRCPIYVD